MFFSRVSSTGCNTLIDELIEFCPENLDDLIEFCPETTEEIEFGDINETYLNDSGTLVDDALEYIAGYIIQKLNLQEYESHLNTFSWVDQVSTCSLKKPKESFLVEIKKLEGVFCNLNGDHISHCQNIRQKLLEKSKAVNLDPNIKEFFFKCRLYFRVRQLNKNFKGEKAIQQAKSKKKGKKTTT